MKSRERSPRWRQLNGENTMRTLTRWKLLTVVCAVSGLVGSGLATDTRAEASERLEGGTTTIAHQVVADARFVSSLATATATNLATGGSVSPLSIPPQGGCSWANLTGSFTSHYVNGALVGVDGFYQGSVGCTATGPDQSMAHMSNIVRVYRDHVVVSDGSVGECNESLVACLFAHSAGEYVCTLYATCAGIYQLMHYPTMLLPDGWVWSSWPPECDAWGGNRELHCTGYSDTVVVTPTIPVRA